MKRAKSASGFTLVELMVVVAIIGVAAALAAPSIRDLSRRQRENEAIVDVEGALRDARNTARVNRRCVTVALAGNVITATKSACTGFKRFGGSAPTMGTADGSKTTTIDDTIVVGALSEPLTFHPYGGTTAVGNVTLTLSSAALGTSRALITVFPGVGTVRKESL